MISTLKKSGLIKFIISTIIVTGLFTNLAAVPDEFKTKIDSFKWITYAPTHFNPDAGQYPSYSSIEQDLRVLLNAGFNGLITYGSLNTLANIPKIAKELGFKGVIMGVWDIFDKNELNNAMVMSKYVDGYCVGNEGLYVRYNLEDLRSVMDYLKKTTQKPVTTAEQITDYAKKDVMELGDWVFPNVHPFLCGVKSPFKAVEWIKKYYQIIKRHASDLDKPVLFKEIGYPTKGDAVASKDNQRKFFILMEMSDVKFAYFEAFDQYWKQWLPVEPYWGLFDKNRVPKKFIAESSEREDEKANKINLP